MIYMEKEVSVITPEAIICVFFKTYPQKTFFNSDLHKAFFKLKETRKYEDILSDIRFSGSSSNPYSEEIAKALANIQYSGALSRQNPDLVKYSTTIYFDEAYTILTENIKEDVISKAEEMCIELNSSLNSLTHGT